MQNNRILFSITALILILFVGSSLISTAVSDTKQQSKESVTGFSLSALHLKASLPDGISFGDRNSKKAADPCRFANGGKNGDTTVDLGLDESRASALNGSYTFVCAQADCLRLNVDSIPVACWQAFRRKDLSDDGKEVEVNGQFLTDTQRKKFLVYEDNDTVVYDFTSLLLPESWNDYLKQYQETCYDKNYDFTWIKKLHDYVGIHASELIQKSKA